MQKEREEKDTEKEKETKRRKYSSMQKWVLTDALVKAEERIALERARRKKAEDAVAASRASRAPLKTEVFIGNLPGSVTHETLAKHCSQYGRFFKLHVILNSEDGSPRGFAFCDFAEYP